MTSTAVRPDIDRLRAGAGERRPTERLRAHYELELSLAERLRQASTAERARVYGEVYDELFASLPDHPQHTAARHGASKKLAGEFRRIAPLLHPGLSFLEIGCGDGALACRAAPHVAQSYGLDVTSALLPERGPGNFQFLQTNGVDIPLATATVGLAYSNQLMEHLHPEDAAAQLREITRVLAPGGRYYCITPNRASGPHDISRYFDYEARGFHLKEYAYRELNALFRSAGFRKVEVIVDAGGRSRRIPYPLASGLEAALLALPKQVRARLATNRYVDRLLGIQVLALR